MGILKGKRRRENSDGFKRYYVAWVFMMDILECRVPDVNLVQARILLLSYNHTLRTMEDYRTVSSMNTMLVPYLRPVL